MRKRLKELLRRLGLLPLLAAARRRVTGRRERRLGAPWTSAGGLIRRGYRSYDQYVEHQRSKLAAIGIARVEASLDAELHAVLRERLERYSFAAGTVVLCLGARRGGEVRAFLDLGCFAVGVDLEPGAGNRYVVTGDFHDLQFPAASVDVVYTNALDHAFDLEKVAAEAARVLKPGGMLIVEAAHGMHQADMPSHWESTFWATTDDLLARLTPAGFTEEARCEVDRPLKELHILLRRHR